MKNVLIIVIGMLLSSGVLCAATNPNSLNPSAQPQLAGDSALSVSSCTATADGFCAIDHALLVPGDGSPMPSCRPGTQGCNDTQLQAQLWAMYFDSRNGVEI